MGAERFGKAPRAHDACPAHGTCRRPGPYALGLKQKGAAGLSEAQACFPATPAFLSGGKLHPYQLEGLRWLFFNWVAGTNGEGFDCAQ